MSRITSSAKFKFGGVIGKVALVGTVGIAGYVAIVIELGSTLLAGVYAFPVLIFAYLIIREIMGYAQEHPFSATAEGTQVVLLHKQMNEAMAAKGVSAPAASPQIQGRLAPIPESELEEKAQ